jgi:hypothetical protein
VKTIIARLAYLIIIVLGVLLHTLIVQNGLTDRTRIESDNDRRSVEAAAGKPPVMITVDRKSSRSQNEMVPDAAPALTALAGGSPVRSVPKE